MDLRTTLVASILILVFTVYYLEKEIGKEGVFWGYAALGIIFGAAAAVQVSHHAPSQTYYILFAAIFTLIAILYYEERGEAEAPKPEGEKVERREEKQEKSRKRAEAESYRELLKDLEESFRKGKISRDVYKRQREEYERKLRALV